MNRLLVANWKMNPDSPREARTLIAATKKAAQSLRRTEIVLCPPAIFLPLVAPSRRVTLGGQDISTELRGAFTGSISAPMVKYSGATYTIIGHSERRYPSSAFSNGIGETNEMINKKIKVALGQGLRVILCVGERERDEQGKYLGLIRISLEQAVQRLPKVAANRLIIAYEPIWAIGGSAEKADTPADFLEQAIFIRKVLSHWCGQALALKLPVLYGGSVNPKNITAFIIQGAADGFLVGHESLQLDHWREIIQLVDQC